MAKWWKFGRDKGKEQAPEPTPAPSPPPAPTPTPASPAEGPKEKKGGLLGRLFGRGKKKKEEAPAAPEPPAAPPTPPAPPTGPPPTGGEPSEGGEEGGEEEAGGKEEAERVYPGSLGVSADGDWQISSTQWSGIMQGVLNGTDVKTFMDAIEAGKMDIAIPLVADAYGIPGGLINVKASTIHHIGY
ncbi:hypothetical protein ACFY9Y_35055 [Streptomyces fimicarius]|uniref:hypothetical protein n=1 Tax=Streptomyces griseus TaxID=1911 RepID=UPI0036E571B7